MTQFSIMNPIEPSGPVPSASVTDPHRTTTSPEKPSLREVFDAEETALLRFAHGIVGRREVAEDIVQDAFLKLHQHWLEVENPRAWLYRAVRNLALNHLRKYKRESALDETPEHAIDSPDAGDALGHQEAVGMLRMLIAEMPAADRKLIQLKYQDGLKYAQISHQTGLSAGNVGYKLHHLLRHLADSMRHLGVESSHG